jgi:hypothetical protein
MRGWGSAPLELEGGCPQPPMHPCTGTTTLIEYQFSVIGYQLIGFRIQEVIELTNPSDTDEHRPTQTNTDI